MSATTSAFLVAAEIRRRDPEIGALKLQKLLYYAQAHHAATFGVPLFSEPLRAWDMGPVVPAVWTAEKAGRAVTVDGNLDEGHLNTVGYVMSRYGRLTGRDLMHLTHAEAPWIDAERERQRKGSKSEPITPAALINYFRNEADDDTPRVHPEDLDDFLSGASERLEQPATRDSRQDILARAQ